MARIRTIKPEFWTDEKIVQLPYEARLLFIGMWNFADDDGFLSDQPDRIKLQVLPADKADVWALIDLLIASDVLEQIILPDESSVLFIKNFDKHQQISHKTKTKFPVKYGKKRIISTKIRREVALKYGCPPGGSQDINCYFCGAPGSIVWWPRQNGTPSYWVSFSGVEIDHLVPESSGGKTTAENIVLSCRYCNRSRGAKSAKEFISRSAPENSGGLRPEGNGKERKDSILPQTEKLIGKVGALGGVRGVEPKSARASKILEDSVPNERQTADAVKAGLDSQQADREWEKFRDHHLARGTKFVNWESGWRTWLSRVGRYNGHPLPIANDRNVYLDLETGINELRRRAAKREAEELKELETPHRDKRENP